MAEPKCDCREGLRDVLNARLFKALGDPSRVGLLAYLAERCEPLTVNEAAQCCPIDVSVVSRHLAVLRDAGILSAVKTGREVRYAVRFPELAQMLRRLADALDACRPAEPPKRKRGEPRRGISPLRSN